MGILGFTPEEGRNRLVRTLAPPLAGGSVWKGAKFVLVKGMGEGAF